jgi:ABC-2 type transport system permease protein
MRERVIEIIRKEFRQAFREPRMRAMFIVPPIIQLLVFGYAVNMDVEHARIAWVDQDRTSISRDLRADFAGSPKFRIVAETQSEDEVRKLIDRGEVDGAVRVLPGFARDVARGTVTDVQVLLNGINSNTASIVASYAAQVVARFSGGIMEQQQRSKMIGRTMITGSPLSVPVPELQSRTRVWFNEELRSRNYFVPGVVVNIITLVTLSLTAMAIVREKEIGTMEQLMVTPIRPIELMLGKTIPFALVGLFDTLLVVGAALLIFRVPFRGNFFLLLGAALLFLLTTLGAGLFVSTISKTQQQAMLTTFLCFMPFFLLSGFTFPVRNMPESVQYLTYLNPVRYFIEVVRGIFLKGSGIDVLWPQLAAMAAFGILILALSAARFRKTID